MSSAGGVQHTADLHRRARAGWRTTERRLQPTPVGRQPDTADLLLAFRPTAPTTPPLGQATVLRLQHSLGNRSVERLLLQRWGGVPPPSSHQIYEIRLREAIAKLQGVAWGRFEGNTRGPDANDRYDTTFWAEQADPHPRAVQQDKGEARMLVLKAGMRPSAAIDALFADPGKWRVECAEFVQVAQLYALRHAQGATAFDQKQSGMSFVIKPHRSSGIVSKQNYSRTAPGTKMVRETDSQEEPKDVEQLLKEAPFGSRVMWSNLQGSGSALNENAIKLGDDEFAAHLPNAKKNTFTRAELELLVAGMTAPQPDAAYVKANIFIAQIQHYDTP